MIHLGDGKADMTYMEQSEDVKNWRCARGSLGDVSEYAADLFLEELVKIRALGEMRPFWVVFASADGQNKRVVRDAMPDKDMLMLIISGAFLCFLKNT